MRSWIINVSCLAILSLAITNALSAAATRVPPPGLSISEKDRTELSAGADGLAREINSLRSAEKRELLPDVEIFHKAVDWALRYDEFYRTNDITLARTLLKQGMERARQLREGKPSWLTATGLVVHGYVSKIDGSVQPYGLVVPATFATDKNKSRRLDIWLHGRDDKLTELKFLSDREKSYGEFTPPDTFVLHPYGRYCNAFKFAGEVDVFEAMEHVKKSYRIDDRRVALRGFSMGGAGAWHLAAHHPDVWAVASPGAGFAETAAYTKVLAKEPKPPAWEQKLWQLYDATDYAANFANLPVVAYNGTEDPQRQAADMMEKAMKAEGLALPRVWGTNVPHKWTPEAKKEVSRFVDEVIGKRRELYPTKIHLTTRTLRYSESFGIRIEGLQTHWERADVELDAAEPNRWSIRTKNVSAFSVMREPVLEQIDRSPPFMRSLQVDGQEILDAKTRFAVGMEMQLHLIKSGNNWSVLNTNRAKAPAKRPMMQGPIDDAFMDSFLVVRPTGKAQTENLRAWFGAHLAKATNEWRAQFRGDARVKDDSQVSDADIAANNLVLFGDPQSNRLLARIADKLPIKWNTQSVQAGGQTFSAATHVPVYIFPNPLNPKRYIVLNSGFTFAAAGSGSNAQQTPKLSDYAVLDTEHGDAVVLADFFDEQWKVK